MISIETGAGGRTYQIWKQQQASSCGVASCWMARGIARQMSFAETEWQLAVRIFQGAVNTSLAAAQTVPGGPMTVDPRAYPNATEQQITSDFSTLVSVGGLTDSEVGRALRNEGLRTQTLATNDTSKPCKVVHNKIAADKPAISLVDLEPIGNAPGILHFVVVGRCTRNHVTFLDPWTGRVTENRNNGRFRGGSGTGTIVSNIYVRA
ncbi:MAG: hypothetical protein ABJP70_10365 [Erythrobacter sp.]